VATRARQTVHRHPRRLRDAGSLDRRAWDEGNLDADVVGLRQATLRNWGQRMAQSSTAQTREQGVRMLATAHAIDVAYGLHSGLACHDLQGLGFKDCNEPAPESSDPMLIKARAARPQGTSGRGSAGPGP
jgi:hypothetical protein